jgi:hypothetical protein
MYNEQYGRPDSEVREAVAFSDGASKGLIHTLDTIGECLADEERRRHHWAALTAAARDDQEAMERHSPPGMLCDYEVSSSLINRSKSCGRGVAQVSD